VYAIKRYGMIPIVIGGGHNNAYPLIKASAKFYEQAIGVINCDPHADCRPLEGRHSGNSFSYALEEGHLAAYSVLGLHRNYNSQYTVDYLRNNDTVRFRFWEDITDWLQELDTAFADITTKGLPLGLELDMDSIAMMPSSAVSPVGLSLSQARAYIRKMAAHQQIAYLHLPEAAPQSEFEKVIVGKALSYLVTDFLHINSHI
jgi:formiminoglutamase